MKSKLCASVVCKRKPEHDERRTFQKGFTKNFLAHYDITPKSVIFEISEKTPITDLTNFQQTVRHYRDQGFEIAIDDVGSGFSGLNLISTVYPVLHQIDMI